MVVATQMVPVDKETATHHVQQFLIIQRLSELIAVEMKKIKKKSQHRVPR